MYNAASGLASITYILDVFAPGLFPHVFWAGMPPHQSACSPTSIQPYSSTSSMSFCNSLGSGKSYNVEKQCGVQGEFETACGARGSDVVILQYAHKVHPEEIVLTSWLPDSARLRVLALHPPATSAVWHPVSGERSQSSHFVRNPTVVEEGVRKTSSVILAVKGGIRGDGVFVCLSCDLLASACKDPPILTSRLAHILTLLPMCARTMHDRWKQDARASERAHNSHWLCWSLGASVGGGGG